MAIENLFRGLVLVGIPLSFGLSDLGVRGAKRHEMTAHGKCMTVFCRWVDLWLAAYITKHMLVGRHQFGVTAEQYWSVYIPVPLVHTKVAVATMGMWATNMFSGSADYEMGTGIGSMVRGVFRHWRLVMQLTFSKTILTPYVVYAMLFHWFS